MAYEDSPPDARAIGLLVIALSLAAIAGFGAIVFWVLHHLRWV